MMVLGLAGLSAVASSRTLLSSGVLTFSPDCSASSYVCPEVHPAGAAVALNAVDFTKADCGKCVKITAPKQFAGLYPISNVMTQGMTGDIDLAHHPLPSTDKAGQRFEVQWEFDAGPCP